MKRNGMTLAAKTKLLRENLAGLKLNQGEVEDAMALHRFTSEHYTDGAKIVSGGRIYIVQQIFSDIKEIKRRLDLLSLARESINEEAISPEQREAAFTEEASLRKAYETSIEQYTKLAKHVEDGALGWAEIEAQHKAIDAEVSKPRSGWKPLKVTTIKSESSE